MTAPSDEIDRLRRELEIAFDVAREIGEERNELAAALGREVAVTQRLRAALQHSYAIVKAAFVSKRADGRYYNDVDPAAQVRIKAALREHIKAALASDNNGGNDGTG